MKSTRRFLTLVLCLVMCLALFPASASAAGIIASGNAGGDGNAEFVLYTDGRMVISGSGMIGAMTTWSFTSGFDGGYQSKNDAIMATRDAIKTLEIKEGITQIDANAFQECPKLTSVELPFSLTDRNFFTPAIGQSAFQDCSSLNDVYIPSNVRSIGASAFQGCTDLTNIYLSDGLTTIGNSAFLDCTALKSVVIPANVTRINTRAFANCNSLKTITFTGNYNNTLFGTNCFANVEAEVYYPVDNDSWNQLLNPMNVPAGNIDFGGRLTWKASAEENAGSDGWVQKNGAWYYYMNGKMVLENWVAYEGRWFYFGKDGRMYTGRQRIGDKYYYFGRGTGTGGDGRELGARVSGWVTDGTNNYFYDDNGVWQPSYSGVNDTGLNLFQNGWQLRNGKWFFVKNQAKVTGWLKWNNNWYYLDPTSGAMVTGWLTWNGNTYYLRPLDVANRDGFPEGSMIAGRSEAIGDDGSIYTFDSSGALKGGRMAQNPLGITTGFRQIGPDWYFYRSDGSMVKDGWELVNSTWYYFNKDGVMQRGWLKWNGNWYYLNKWQKVGANWDEITDPTDPAPGNAGAMATGFATIPYSKENVNTEKTYFFKSNGALNGKGWIKQNSKWYYLSNDGTVVTGWFRDGSKWYYLDDGKSDRPNGSGKFNRGEMVTGVFTVPDFCDGVSNDPKGEQSFKANGEWIGKGASSFAAKAGGWNKDENGKWRYYDTDNKPVSGWLLENNKWYYLDAANDNIMVIGWKEVDGETYYFDGSGALKAGWQQIDGVWYYLNPEHDGTYGARQVGWVFYKNKWYYLAESGKTGAMQVGWEKRGTNEWYYLDPNNGGAMHDGGWMKLDGKWYYLNPEHDGTFGKQLQGWQKDGGNWYYMQKSTDPKEGWMLTGRVEHLPDYTTNTGDYTYYFDPDGHMVTNADRDGHHYGDNGRETS